MANGTSHIVDLPVEIIYTIFSHVDGITFQRCKQVCHKWKDIAYRIEIDPRLWLRFNEREHKYIYKQLEYRSKLSPFQIYQNIKLWDKVNCAKYSLKTIYQSNNVAAIAVCVYKDVLILCTIEGLKYFDLNKEKVIMEDLDQFICCEENDHFLMALTVSRVLNLTGKLNKDDMFSHSYNFSHSHVNLCCQYENKCYFLTFKNELWCCTWQNSKWKKQFMARYYGTVPIKWVLMYCDEVYLTTQLSVILKPTKNKKFTRVKFPYYPNYAEPVYHLNAYNVVQGTSSLYNWMDHHDVELVRVMNCFREYGNVLIIGGFECEIEIYNRCKADREPIPEQRIDVGSFLGSKDTIRAIDVRELDKSHEIYVCTSNGHGLTIVKIALEHPG